MKNPHARKWIITKGRAVYLLLALTLSILPGTGHGDVSSAEEVRFNNALKRAQAVLSTGNLFWSKILLRQAYGIAPSARTKTDLERIIRRVSLASPLSVQVRFSVSPSENVNDGSETSIIWIGGLPYELDMADRQLSGIGANTALSLAYRLSESKLHKVELLANLYFKSVWADAPAVEVTPDESSPNYNRTVFSAGVRSTLLVLPKIGPTEFTASVGETWRGGVINTKFLDGRTAQIIRLGSTSFAKSMISLRQNWRSDSDFNDSLEVLASLDWERSINNWTYSLGAFVNNVSSLSPLSDSKAFGFSASTSLPEVYRIVPLARVTIDQRDFGNWPTGTSGRTDSSMAVNFDFEILGAEYFGFSPVFNAGYRKVESTVDIFDREDATFGLSVNSKF